MEALTREKEVAQEKMRLEELKLWRGLEQRARQTEELHGNFQSFASPTHEQHLNTSV